MDKRAIARVKTVLQENYEKYAAYAENNKSNKDTAQVYRDMSILYQNLCRDLDTSYPSDKSAAKLLPDGWYWEDYDDGSGYLCDPRGRKHFVYDVWAGEYYSDEDMAWVCWNEDTAPMQLDEFKLFAEQKILKNLE